MASMIGIKIASGEFYSIIEENTGAKKRLVLTTVHDGQNSMQIDLYRSQIQSMTDAQYIGSIVVENIKAKKKGEPSIELVISSTSNGNLSADATDLDLSAGAEHQHLAVSLKSLEKDSREYAHPDYEVEASEPPPQGLYDKASRIREMDKAKKAPWIIIIIIGFLLLLAGAALWFFLFRDRGGAGDPVAVEPLRPSAEGSASPEETPLSAETPAGPPAPPERGAGSPALEAQPVPAAPRPVPEENAVSSPQAETPPPVRVIEAPLREPPASPETTPRARRNRPPAPVSSYRIPPVIPREGVPYRIRWGDTLWDIAEAFYRNPWLYPRIARFNNIRNPDLIISGRTIRIPPKN